MTTKLTGFMSLDISPEDKDKVISQSQHVKGSLKAIFGYVLCLLDSLRWRREVDNSHHHTEPPSAAETI